MIDKGRFLAITVFITAHTAILEELKPYQHPNNYTEQQKKIYRMYLRVFQLFLANLGALISNLKPDFFYHV